MKTISFGKKISLGGKTSLGSSAFVGDEETFLRVDVDAEKKFLKEQGTTHGEQNFPGVDACTPCADEQEIVEKIAQTVEQTQSDLGNHIGQFYDRLVPITKVQEQTALINRIEEMPVSIKNALNDLLRRFKDKFAIIGPERQNAQKSFDTFRKDNNLVRPAKYFSLPSIIVFGVILATVEVVLNTGMFMGVNGIYVALSQSILITFFNVLVLAGLMGMFYRFKNCVSRLARWPIVFAFIGFILALVVNIGVGHYRDAISEAKAKAEELQGPIDWNSENNDFADIDYYLDYAQKAMDSITHSFFSIGSIESVFLILVGLCFCGIASCKWYSSWDVYPGYKGRDAALKQAHKNYENLVNVTHKAMQEKIDNTLELVADESTKVTTMRTQHAELTDRARTLCKSYESWCVALGKTQDALLEAYRTSNRLARSDTDPKYFDEAIVIDSKLTYPPIFEPPNLGNVDAVFESVKLAEEKINKIADEKWEEFNMSKNMRQADEPNKLI